MDSFTDDVFSISLIVATFFYSISLYGRLFLLRRAASQKLSDIYKFLSERDEVVLNLVNLCERHIDPNDPEFKQMIRARNFLMKVVRSGDVKNLASCEIAFRRSFSMLVTLAQQHPHMKNEESFDLILANFSDFEPLVAGTSHTYNKSVEAYNAKIRGFPNLIISRVLNFRKLMSLKFCAGETKNSGLTPYINAQA